MRHLHLLHPNSSQSEHDIYQNNPKALEHLQEVRLRQARRYRKALRAVQSKPEAILERRQEGRRRSCWRVASGNCRWEDEEEKESIDANI